MLHMIWVPTSFFLHSLLSFSLLFSRSFYFFHILPYPSISSIMFQILLSVSRAVAYSSGHSYI
ncbi:hypothetical protein J3R30DRAFT_3428254 [Lentinula aciculospora]|uniref:Uncharacterized protein n=1 Tax=Lentinula aciculospora TaxID=153920 RepID=A0A9W9AUU7_9AGAR|nr:hypothetical protein J3R30DRAFT_3428254 [Lentinula aciculospora]